MGMVMLCVMEALILAGSSELFYKWFRMVYGLLGPFGGF